ncbi:alternative ribosome rescue aminoacyl-tRNA hydrolase ArfB [Psychroserpens sp.]|uniref:alternative ribosome rescue aminoacyl-tRNA hydrolase ArfB n=1 Tax=Psychroserpens sp. TaxID=2020870 RepID=UPI001B014847|nr:alternative ribosome rescue aminoacyl-tRNA hydrolase ArfB [Psychroserpens sp.]MBO6605612.1 aminoacyl-tRNA hydrolase [Psychroserpens sp.]MBO6632519.1 aminoacyl-tRNA hydrolase [Psychroserpens sp.]MBO6653579.1 aminoacyl-tRNA hydrolase [Psychroserpens sp.]MBO6681900.1 aminoacyl-tRNA hydrolase [Psychroserpens sp.]MBO6748986.1 aminoacyl-tRNA hydrolase [Psychroserpens sp.]
MFDEQSIVKELSFKAIRSSGAGGQHVNKTSSKVELYFDLLNSKVLSTKQKELLVKNLAYRLTKNSELILQCDESRSQHKNKTIVTARFIDLIKTNLIEEKERIPTKIPKAVIKKRLTDKRKQSDKKANRKPPKID